MKVILENLIVGQGGAELIGALAAAQAHYFGVAVVLWLSGIFGHFAAIQRQQSAHISK